MFDDFKDKVHEKNKKRHEKLCAEGKHDWFQWSHEEGETDYVSYGGPGPMYSITTYKCRWCDAEDIQTSGEPPEDYDDGTMM